MAGIRMENKIYEVGMYCRLSKDDGTDNESASIATQKSILTDYVKKQGWHLAKTYVDDGYSGTNFQRPSFQNMIKDIESGLINCVITKDLSRLGRNYLDCGLYLEVFFPEHNVRYIAVNDGVDTLNKSAMDITPFRNILNEMYSADVSVKIKSAYRARFQQGKFMGTTAPYGYVKDPADHNHLLIDDKVAHVVREIFDLALAGNGIAKIRKHINKQHILRPAAYAAEQGATGYERYFEENEENRYIWSENSVRGILRSPIYAGNLAGYKRIAANMKSKKRPSKLPEEWEVIPDTHEGIVTQEEFDTVQQLITSRRLPENKGGFENIFAGVIKCADCGYAMRAMSANRRKRPDIIDCVQYSCNNYGRYGNIMCTAHSIEARDLFNAVLTDINRFADMAVNDEKAVRAIEKRLTETDQSKAKALEKEQRKLNKRLAELDRLFSSLYEDKVMERITERNFEMMSGKYQKEQLEIEARLKEVTETLSDSYEKTQGVRDFLSLIRNYQGIKELDATIINALIDKILVSEREKLTDGMVRQEIKIYYKFIGFVGELHITPTKRWTALKPKNCTVCGVEYVPRSGISKYCPACAKKIQREKSNESKRRSRERNRQACIELSAKNDRLMWINENNIPIVEDIEGGIVQNADSEGLAIICSEGKYGLTDYTGNMTQDCIYDSLETIPGYRGLYKAEKDGKYGIIDKDGKVVVDIQYEDFNFFDEKHLGREQLELGNEQLKDLDYKKALEYYQGVLNLEGKEAEAYEHIVSLYIMQEDYQEAQKILEEAIQKLSEKEEEPKDRLELFADMAEKHLEQEKKEENSGTNLYPVFENGKWGFKNKEDKTLISPVYDSIKEYHSQGLAPVQKDGKWGFIDEKGEEVISCKFEDVKLFDDQGYAAFCENGKWGYMDMSGKVIVKAQYEDAGDFSGNGLASVKKDGKWGWINENGEVVIEPIYEMVSEFDKKGLAVVEIDGIQTWINESGVELSKEEKTEVLSQDDEGYAIVKKGKKMLIEDFQGNTLLKGKYDSIEKIPCWPDLYKVSKKDKYGCIDKNGNVVLELQYDDFTYYDQDHLAYFEKDENGNIVGMRYEGEEPQTIEGTYEDIRDVSGGNTVATDTNILTFHLDGTFSIKNIFTVVSIAYPAEKIQLHLPDGGSVYLLAGESYEHMETETVKYTIKNGYIQGYEREIPVSEITQN